MCWCLGFHSVFIRDTGREVARGRRKMLSFSARLLPAHFYASARLPAFSLPRGQVTWQVKLQNCEWDRWALFLPPPILVLAYGPCLCTAAAAGLPTLVWRKQRKKKFSFGNGHSRESRREARNEEKRERAHVPADFRVSHPLRNSQEKWERAGGGRKEYKFIPVMHIVANMGDV